MRLRRPSLAESVVAAACGLWVTLFLMPTTTTAVWAVPIALTIAALVLVLPQRPLIAAAGLATMQWALSLTQVTDGSPALLAPFIIAVYSLGRHASLWPGAAVAVVFTLSAIVEASAPPLTLVFALVLTAAMFAYGRLVQHRASTAARSRATASRLQSTDAAAVAARIVADERARLGGQALALLRDAVDGMRSDAAAAKRDLDPDLIESIAVRGRQAVTELRWLLGLLRSTPTPVPAASPRRSTRWIVDAGIAAVLVALGLLEVAGSPVAPSPVAWAFAVAMPACTVVRERHPTWALGGAAVVMGFAVIADLPLTASGILCVVLLSWSALAVDDSSRGSVRRAHRCRHRPGRVQRSREHDVHRRAHRRHGVPRARVNRRTIAPTRAATARADALQADLDARVDVCRREFAARRA